MSLAKFASQRWSKLKSALETLDRALDYSPLEEQARRLAAIEARLNELEAPALPDAQRTSD